MPRSVTSIHHPALPDSGRNQNFDTFVGSMKELAAQHAIDWDIPLDERGIAVSGKAWDLRRIAKDGRPKSAVLRSLNLAPDGLDAAAARAVGSPRRPDGPLPVEWQDFLKALMLEYLLVRRKSIPFAVALGPAIRFLAAVVDKDPWKLTAEDVQLTIELSDKSQPSKGRSTVLQGLLSTVVDRLHLADASPIMGLVKRSAINRSTGRSRFYLAHDKLAKSLSERKQEAKLPDQRAFWELVRIVFTEKPRTVNDALRFAMAKVLLFTGMRVGEIALLPFEWRRSRTYLDNKGKPAGDSGGISEALLLRHFAEKQGTTDLYETTQFVPEIFRNELEQALAQVESITAPLRKTLKAQYESGRIFPMYESDALVDAVEMYVRLTGNPLWALEPTIEVAQCVERYQESWDVKELDTVQALQSETAQLAPRVSRFFSPENRSKGLILRDQYGLPYTGRGVRGKWLLISDVEDYVRNHAPTKVSDLKTFRLDNGTTMAPWEMLFLLPKRAVGAGRGDSVLDLNMTYSVGVADEVLLQDSLFSDDQRRASLFASYGLTEQDRKLKILSHSLRHLQNTELFRLGVADTIITKRFNRRSVAQSYEYDHRSLAEEMDELELPGAWEEYLGDSKATTVAKLIQAGRAHGPIVEEFERILKEEGEEPALRFLAAEADGFHSTPYGHCLNSFTVDPCPKHLECFSGCLHLSATDLPENRRNLLALHGKLKIAMEAAQARPASTIGRDNQIAHAKIRLEGVERLLSTPPGRQAFPGGRDLSKLDTGKSVLDGS